MFKIDTQDQRITELFPDSLREILTQLHREFKDRRQELLAAREQRQAEFDTGTAPGFIESHPSHTGDWKVAPIPEDCKKRRVEITGPVNNRKMVINMLNPSADGVPADMAMLDFEDSMAPAWQNVLDGYENAYGAWRGDLRFVQEKDGKVYELHPTNRANPMVRVRGLHMAETAITVDDEPIAAGLLDLTVCAFHSAKWLVEQKRTPMFYVPKIEHYTEARWWDDVFAAVERSVEVPHSTLRLTALIETLPATFQIREILFELKDHALGFNGGRWDKIFSDIKVLREHKDRIMADRSWINMERPWMDNYQKLIIKICHTHGAFAMGGMSAFTPGKTEEIRNQQTEKVRADKRRESEMGCDGCWVSHPYFIKHALDQFPHDNQNSVMLEDFPMQPELLPSAEGPKTLQGLRTNVRVGIAYMQGWQNDIGCVAFDGLMEDLATLEISRAQTWQWLKHEITLDGGEVVTESLVKDVFKEELDKILSEFSLQGDLAEDFRLAARGAEKIFLSKELVPFLTLVPKNFYEGA